MNIYVAKNQEKQGPYTSDEVRAKVATGEFTGSDLAWHEGVTDWQPLAQLLPAAPFPAPSLAAPLHPTSSSGLATASFIIAMVGIGGWFLLLGIAAAGVSSGAKDTSPLMVAVGLCMFAGLAVNLAGAIFGLITFRKLISNRWMALTGAIVNGVELLGVLGLIILGIASK
jgi:hypothetical protein